MKSKLERKRIGIIIRLTPLFVCSVRKVLLCPNNPYKCYLLNEIYIGVHGDWRLFIMKIARPPLWNHGVKAVSCYERIVTF